MDAHKANDGRRLDQITYTRQSQRLCRDDWPGGPIKTPSLYSEGKRPERLLTKQKRTQDQYLI